MISMESLSFIYDILGKKLESKSKSISKIVKMDFLNAGMTEEDYDYLRDNHYICETIKYGIWINWKTNKYFPTQTIERLKDMLNAAQEIRSCKSKELSPSMVQNLSDSLNYYGYTIIKVD